ncbi:hypothetical protein [Mesorhizobium sp. ORM16]|uniref:hypothetical protein n=1 Tax=Mesorhizobium sp. ORM16 TaxID=3376989 RepID=UPI00385762F7
MVTAANLNAVVAPHEPAENALQMPSQSVGLEMRLWWTPEGAFLARLSKADIYDLMRDDDARAKAVERAFQTLPAFAAQRDFFSACKTPSGFGAKSLAIAVQ